MKTTRILTAVLVAAGLFAARNVRAAEAHKHDHGPGSHAAGTITVTGEVLDMACYLDHGAQGEKHAACAKTCIESGLPVGIKTADGKTYLVIGEHKPLNQELAKYAAKTITVKGKLVERDGFKMIANVELSSTTGEARFTCPTCGGSFAAPGKGPKCGMKLVGKK